MATLDEERYLRNLLLLGEGTSFVLKSLVVQEVSRSGQTLENLLLIKKTLFNRILKEQHDILYPAPLTANADLTTWDLSLLLLVVKRLFYPVLPLVIVSQIAALKAFRDSIIGHPRKMSMDDTEYLTNQAHLQGHLRNIAIHVRQSHQVEDIIRRTATGNIDIESVYRHVDEIHAFRTSLKLFIKEKFEQIEPKLNSLESDVKTIKENVDAIKDSQSDPNDGMKRRLQSLQDSADSSKQDIKESRGCQDMISHSISKIRNQFVRKTKYDFTKGLKTIIQAECENEVKQKKAINLLFDFVKIIQDDDSFSDDEIKLMISQRVECYGEITYKLIDDMTKWFTDINKVSDGIGTAQLGCIILPIFCSSVTGCFTVLEYVNSSLCKKHLARISTSVSNLFGFPCSFTWGVEPTSFQSVLASYFGTKRSKKKLNNLVLPIHVTDIEGLKHIWKMFGGQERNCHIENVSRTLSAMLGEDIRLRTYVDKDRLLETVQETGLLPHPSGNMNAQIIKEHDHSADEDKLEDKQPKQLIRPQLHDVKEAPKIDLRSLPVKKNIHMIVGEPLKLFIGISGSPTPTVTWLKDGNPIERATKSNNENVAKLEITKADRIDTGKYQIKVENEIGSDTADIIVIDFEDPNINHTNLPVNKEVNVIVGEPLKLATGISGSPTPTVTWLKDSERIEGAKKSNDDDVAKLEITKAKCSDTGKYQIEEEYEIGSDTADISVIVLEAPNIDLTSFPANMEIHVMVGEPLELVIRISGSPTPTVTWLKDGNPIERTQKSNTNGEAKLEIRKTERSDTGKYQIKVENEIGSYTAYISVFVLDKPGAPGVPKLKTTTEDSITLSWTPPNTDGGIPVTGYVLERREKGDDIWETSSCSVNQVTEFTATGLQEGKEYEFHVAACNNAGTGEFSNCSEPIQVQSPQDTKRNMQASCIFDGRLILVESSQIKMLEKSLDKEPIGQGRIGTVYRCNNQEIFGITVAVKKIKTKEHSNQIKREKIVPRLMNPFLLPLLAVIEKSYEECWFISPYCESGDLYDAIKRGKNEKDAKNNTDETSINNQATRVKILLQIALAIKYIHTEVPNVRGPILHKDIASKNVVLDKYLNARLIDFGLAREKNDDMSTFGGRKHYDHPKVGTGCDEDYFDYYDFGVIIREMLTSLGPEGENNLILKKMNNNQIEERLDKTVWKCNEMTDKLKELSQKCLRGDAKWSIEDFKSNVVDTLQDMFLAFDCNIFENGGESTCHQCIINPIVSAEKSTLTKDYENCRQKIQVCMACEKNSFLYPITCYCGAILTSAIGSNWGALLVAGDDDNPGKAAVMKKEILELERLVTSQAPRIIGIRQHNVKTVVPSENNVEKMSAWTKIQKHIEAFTKATELETLLIYFSCHGQSSVEGDMIHLGKKEYISSDVFQKELDKLKKIDQLIIFLDRCFPTMVKFTDRKFIQINACSDKDAAVLKEEGSLFTKYVIQGLKARSEERECPKDCQHCVDYWKPKTEYISVFTLFDYVNNHLQQKAPDPYWQGQGVGKNIAFFTGEVVEIEFTLKDEKRCKRLALKYLKHFDEVRGRLFEAFGVDQITHEVKIQKETFRQDQPYDECDTLEKVMQAWLKRLPLVVTFTAKSIN